MTVSRRSFLGGMVAASIVAVLALDYAYYHGFDDGADASLCVIALQVDGQGAVDTEPSCKRIANRQAPPRVFPGTSGDEPTIWTPK